MRLPLASVTAAVLVGCASSPAPTAAESAHEDNAVLARAFAEDQADDERAAFVYEDGSAMSLDDLRQRLPYMPPELADDVRRLVAVDSVLAAGGARTAGDFYHAAVVYQHGADATSYRRAHDLARRAVELDPDHSDAKWLTAASWDRYLDESDRPQWYGTQYRCEDGLRRLLPVEEGRVTDEERRALGVPTLAEARAREGTECGS